jgi:hypothetical protein
MSKDLDTVQGSMEEITYYHNLKFPVDVFRICKGNVLKNQLSNNNNMVLTGQCHEMLIFDSFVFSNSLYLVLIY